MSLRYEAPVGTKVEVQSTQYPEKFCEGIVDQSEKVRAENGAVINEENFVVVGEKDERVDPQDSPALRYGDMQ